MIALVTDSTVYLTKAEAASLGVRVVPIGYAVSGQVYQESYSDHNGDFLSLIAQNMGCCTTSQTSVSAFMSVFEELIRQNHQVLCIVLSSRLSGVYSSASIAAREVGRDQVIVVDSLTTAGGLALLVKRAKELIRKGLKLHEAAAEVERLRGGVGIAFSVESMDPLRRSGRLGIVRQSVGTVLNIRPILMCEDGAVVSCGTARGRQERVKKLIERIPGCPEEIIVHYLNSRDDVDLLLFSLKKRFPEIALSVSRLGPVLGIHLGLGVIAAVWITR